MGPSLAAVPEALRPHGPVRRNLRRRRLKQLACARARGNAHTHALKSFPFVSTTIDIAHAWPDGNLVSFPLLIFWLRFCILLLFLLRPGRAVRSVPRIAPFFWPSAGGSSASRTGCVLASLPPAKALCFRSRRSEGLEDCRP